MERDLVVPFGDRLAAAVERRGTPLVLGLDPDPARGWPGDPEPPEGTPAERAAAAVEAWCGRLIDAAGPACVAVKLQLACFERLGAPGWTALEAVAAAARDADLLVIADAKRGDIDVSAAAYAAGLTDGLDTPYGHVAGLGADAVTVNPLMGRDAIAPFVDAARRTGGGVFLLVRTSNPGAADLQERELADGRPLWAHVAELTASLDDGRGALSDVGAVCGATAPERVAALRELLPRAPFLLPGVGAQGGSVDALGSAFTPGLAGGLVTVSRGVARAHELTGGDPAIAARDAAARLRDACVAAAGPAQ